MANDEDVYVRIGVANNPNTPPEVLAFLANDELWLVRYFVADNPNTPHETLDRLADIHPCTIRLNSNTPQYIKEYLNAVEFWRECYEY
jgi:hypothetical protein